MTSKLQQMGKFIAPVMLLGMMAGCATTSDLEKVQKQANEAKAIAVEARNTANAASAASASAERAASEANGFAAAAMKSSEEAVAVAVKAQKTVNEATIAVPWMRYDPTSGRFSFSWMIWPGADQQAVASPAPAPASQAPAPNGTKP